MDSRSDNSVTFFGFLDRMRHPASLDLVRSIKSFLVSFSFYTSNTENDSKKVQEFFLRMETAIRDHPLWANASEEDIDCALEGLEKYVMTKLFSRTFASSPKDVKIDEDVSDKICLLQTFLRPEHLDIPTVLQNEASWLLAGKELKKINAFKAPREKLLCIMNCCKVINNLLLNASASENHVLAGADDFLPILIYVTIKANPSQLHSNLKFIQLYRRQAKLVSEASYYLTNLVSAKTFLVDLNAKSLSIEELEFEESMQAARLTNKFTQFEPSPVLDGTKGMPDNCTTIAHIEDTNISDDTKGIPDHCTTITHTEDTNRSARLHYPFMEAEAGELTVGDVERLLALYKEVVTNYTSLYNGIGYFSISRRPLQLHELTGDSSILAEEKCSSSAVSKERGREEKMRSQLGGEVATVGEKSTSEMEEPPNI